MDFFELIGIFLSAYCDLFSIRLNLNYSKETSFRLKLGLTFDILLLLFISYPPARLKQLLLFELLFVYIITKFYFCLFNRTVP
jgi:hypothetical protein